MALKRKPVLEGSYGMPAEDEGQDQPSTGAVEEPSHPTADATVATVTTLTPAAPSSNPEHDPEAEQDELESDSEESSQVDPPVEPTTAKVKPKDSTAAAKAAAGRRKEPLRAQASALRADQRVRANVEDAYKSAKRRPREWGTAPIRIAQDVKDRLADRRAADVEKFGVSFAETHYMEAALAAVPDDPDTAYEWVDKYLDTLDLQAPETVGTTGRIRTETSKRFSDITNALRRKHGYGKIGHLQTAAVTRLLDALDRLDNAFGGEVVELD